MINEEKAHSNKRKNVKSYLAMQGLNIIFSLSGVIMKMASLAWQKNGFFSHQTILNILCYLILMLTYAFFWQKIIKKVSLSSAYLSKGLLIFWSLIWAAIIFDETITIQNIIGTAIIFGGTLLVADNE